MSADNPKMKLKGKVICKTFGKGSKSEHEAIYIETEQGEYVLRKAGSNSFENNELIEFVGKEVIATGVVKAYLFVVTEIREV